MTKLITIAFMLAGSVLVDGGAYAGTVTNGLNHTPPKGEQLDRPVRCTPYTCHHGLPTCRQYTTDQGQIVIKCDQ